MVELGEGKGLSVGINIEGFREILNIIVKLALDDF